MLVPMTEPAGAGAGAGVGEGAGAGAVTFCCGLPLTPPFAAEVIEESPPHPKRNTVPKAQSTREFNRLTRCSQIRSRGRCAVSVVNLDLFFVVNFELTISVELPFGSR